LPGGEFNSDPTAPKNCTIFFHEVPEGAPKETFFAYYGLTKFYQNYRNYQVSRQNDQLNGEFIAESDSRIRLCDPVIYMSDLKPEQQQMLNTKQPFPANQTLAIPCGLVAKSQFNDEFILWKVDPITKARIKKVDINR